MERVDKQVAKKARRGAADTSLRSGSGRNRKLAGPEAEESVGATPFRLEARPLANSQRVNYFRWRRMAASCTVVAAVLR